MILGRCPYCGDGNIEVRDKEVGGKKVKLFACSNAHWQSEDGELFELTPDSTCGFRIWQNSLSKYGKYFTYKDIRQLLRNETLEVELLSKKYGKKIYYHKHVLLNREYGVCVLWD